MTTLAGAVPRMMRPGPGQNYPRSGFPLEGKKGPQRRPKPRGRGEAAPPSPGSPQARPGAHSRGTPAPGGNSRARSRLDFLWANEAPFSQVLAELGRQACSWAIALASVVLEMPWWGEDQAASEHQKATSQHFVHQHFVHPKASQNYPGCSRVC